MDPETLARIEANAQLVTTTMGTQLGVALAYDQAGVQYLEDYLLRLQPQVDEALIDGLSNVVGCWLGECIRHNYGGSWQHSESGLGVSFDEKNAAYPVNKVGKLLRNGPEDSIVSFYNVVPLLLARQLPGLTAPGK